MKAPVLHPQESLRLAEIHAMEILDTPSEERFDRFTRMAQRIFSVEICLITLVDMNRQWFKSCYGPLGAPETPRDISFCGHAILQDDTFVIHDALLDERFADNPLVTGHPHIRFYAGEPLKSPNGFNIGTLCLIGRSPRNFAETEKLILKDLARGVEREFVCMELSEALTLNRKLEESRQALIQSSRMKSLGEMAKGMAHEVNNPLAILQGRLSQLESSLSGMSDKQKLFIQSMESGIERIAKATRGLRSFAQDFVQEEIVSRSLKSIVDDTLIFCAEKARAEGVNIVVDADENHIAPCCPTNLSQALWNILLNAFEALENITSPQPRTIELKTFSNEKFCGITIADSGPGIPEEILESIWTPFFSTKAPNRHSGLGLSIAKGLVENQGGTLRISSPTPGGCRVVVSLQKTGCLTLPG